jgi:hypothetical protein
MIMPFKDPIAEDAYQLSTKPICAEVGLSIVRADEILSLNPIIDDIRAAIDYAPVIIVDISGSNPNVFYELGIAHILRRERTVIITHDELGRLPFDVAHIRIIPYANTMAGKPSFEKKLRETLQEVTKDLSETYRDEFAVAETMMSVSLDDVELYYLLAMEALDESFGLDTPIKLVEAKRPSGGPFRITQLGSTTRKDRFAAFLALEYVTLIGGKFSFTEKGRGFVNYLKKRGYVAYRLNDVVITKGYESPPELEG